MGCDCWIEDIYVYVSMDDVAELDSNGIVHFQIDAECDECGEMNHFTSVELESEEGEEMIEWGREVIREMEEDAEPEEEEGE